VSKSLACGNFGHRTHRDRRCPHHKCAHCGQQGHNRLKRRCQRPRTRAPTPSRANVGNAVAPVT
jgi:hypothetical protein